MKEKIISSKKEPKNSNKEVGERLRIFRREELGNLSQGAMAESVGLKQGSYSDIERGKAGVTGILTKLILKYRVNPIWLLEGIGIRRINEPTLMLLCTEISDLEELLKQSETSGITKLYDVIDQLEKQDAEQFHHGLLTELKKEISTLVAENSRLQKDLENKDKTLREFSEKHKYLKDLFEKFSKGL